jgi:hypothetical protein
MQSDSTKEFSLPECDITPLAQWLPTFRSKVPPQNTRILDYIDARTSKLANSINSDVVNREGYEISSRGLFYRSVPKTEAFQERKASARSLSLSLSLPPSLPPERRFG